MTEPLALLLYEKLLPGSQLVNRLQDLKYRVHTISEPSALVPSAEQQLPMIVLADLASSKASVPAELQKLKQNPATSHLPVIAFGAEDLPDVRQAALAVGNTVIASEVMLLNHLPQLLQQALRID
jgi:CheY-like chemotaxis protein